MAKKIAFGFPILGFLRLKTGSVVLTLCSMETVISSLSNRPWPSKGRARGNPATRGCAQGMRGIFCTLFVFPGIFLSCKERR